MSNQNYRVIVGRGDPIYTLEKKRHYHEEENRFDFYAVSSEGDRIPLAIAALDSTPRTLSEIIFAFGKKCGKGTLVECL